MLRLLFTLQRGREASQPNGYHGSQSVPVCAPLVFGRSSARRLQPAEERRGQPARHRLHQPHNSRPHYHNNITHMHTQEEVPPSPVLNSSTISSRRVDIVEKLYASVGIGRTHPPPAAPDVPGQARKACSSGCSRSGAPETSTWGLEEFTRTMHLTGLLALSSPCITSRASFGRVATV